jgi:sporulation protein YlmC with PRC-barrel domain
MHCHIRSRFILGIAAASLMSSAALAQTSQPNVGSTATTVTATTTTVTATKWMTQELAGQWRASKMIGLNVYNKENEKIGDISEIIVDRSGKLEAVVVGAGGFLGIGERDVAVPYSQITWVDQPVAPARTGTSGIPMTTGAANTASHSTSYPDHAVLDMAKDQLKAAPAFKFSR